MPKNKKIKANPSLVRSKFFGASWINPSKPQGSRTYRKRSQEPVITIKNNSKMSNQNLDKIKKLKAEIGQIRKDKQEAMKELEGPWRDIKTQVANLELFTVNTDLQRELFGRRIVYGST